MKYLGGCCPVSLQEKKPFGTCCESSSLPVSVYLGSRNKMPLSLGVVTEKGHLWVTGGIQHLPVGQGQRVSAQGCGGGRDRAQCNLAVRNPALNSFAQYFPLHILSAEHRFASSCCVQMCFPCQEQALPEEPCSADTQSHPELPSRKLSPCSWQNGAPPIAEWAAQGGRDVNKQSLLGPR